MFGWYGTRFQPPPTLQQRAEIDCETANRKTSQAAQELNDAIRALIVNSECKMVAGTKDLANQPRQNGTRTNFQECPHTVTVHSLDNFPEPNRFADLTRQLFSNLGARRTITCRSRIGVDRQ